MSATGAGAAPGGGALYRGTVVHVRRRPHAHRLAYNVFALLLDLGRLDETIARTRWLSRNRFNLFSLYDRDYGAGSARLPEHARQLFASAGVHPDGGRILMLAYPRVLGYVFNPLTVYYAFDAGGQLTALAYEVTNTFRQRHTYVVHAGGPENGVHAHGCEKHLYVSPFTPMAGRYAFRVTRPAERLLVGVALHDGEGALLRTHFSGEAQALDDTALLSAAASYPVMTLKVIGAIHLEALRLWWKGVPLVARPEAPPYAVTAPARPGRS